MCVERVQKCPPPLCVRVWGRKHKSARTPDWSTLSTRGLLCAAPGGEVPRQQAPPRSSEGRKELNSIKKKK